MISSNTETLLKRAVPLTAFTVASWFTYKKRENLQEAIFFGAIVALLTYLALGPLVKGLASLSKRPTAGNYNLSNIPANWSPEAITRELADDINGNRLLLNDNLSYSLYTRVSSLNDDQLVSIYNFWRKNFFGENDETLTQAMAAESYWMDSRIGEVTKKITARLKAKSCY